MATDSSGAATADAPPPPPPPPPPVESPNQASADLNGSRKPDSPVQQNGTNDGSGGAETGKSEPKGIEPRGLEPTPEFQQFLDDFKAAKAERQADNPQAQPEPTNQQSADLDSSRTQPDANTAAPPAGTEPTSSTSDSRPAEPTEPSDIQSVREPRVPDAPDPGNVPETPQPTNVPEVPEPTNAPSRPDQPNNPESVSSDGSEPVQTTEPADPAMATDDQTLGSDTSGGQNNTSEAGDDWDDTSSRTLPDDYYTEPADTGSPQNDNGSGKPEGLEPRGLEPTPRVPAVPRRLQSRESRTPSRQPAKPAGTDEPTVSRPGQQPDPTRHSRHGATARHGAHRSHRRLPSH